MLKMANFHAFIYKIGMRRKIYYLFFDWCNFCLLTNQQILYKQCNSNQAFPPIISGPISEHNSASIKSCRSLPHAN
jgi:hypothetical protein